MIDLRPYQVEAVESIYSYFGKHTGNCLIVLPTGTGKSLVLAEFIRRSIHDYPDTRILCLTHVRELIAQNYAQLLRLWPDAPAGVYSAGLNRRDLYQQVLFCGIQSVYKKAEAIQRTDLVIVDEAHLIGRGDAGMYRRFLKDLTAINPWLKVVGLTATAYRLDSGYLHRGEGALFDAIAYEANLGDMVEQGYLAPLTTKRTRTNLDVTGVHTRGGDFIPGELERAVNVAAINEAIAAEIIEKGADRGSWLVFCAGKDHARALCTLLPDAACVFGDTPVAERDRLIGNFKRGDLRALVNVGVLTTGFDAPGVDLIAMCRPTKSTGLYVQQLGRGTRLAEGKENAVVLDFAGNIARFGPADAVQPPDPGKKKGDGIAPVKVCPDCEAIVHASRRVCPDCGHQFPAPDAAGKLAHRAAQEAVLTRDIEDTWLAVTDVRYRGHLGQSGAISMRVEYQCGPLSTYSEYVCLEHTGYARERAVMWWQRRAPGSPVPHNVAAAIPTAELLPRPTHIHVRPDGKYFRIQGVRFDHG